MFYPSNPTQLREQIQRYLDDADAIEAVAPYGLIAPHAGYAYSGPVAGWAFKQIIDRDYEAVIVLSPSHSDGFHFVSVMTDGAYETPLGQVPVDMELARSLVQVDDSIIQSSLRGHLNRGWGASEHALEVELPFLQVVLGDFKLVPVVMGMGGWSICQRLGEALARITEHREILIVASSDLSHFHPYDEAYRLDQMVIEEIKTGNAERIAEACSTRELEACGGAPIAALLSAADLTGMKRIEILNHATSGDVPEGMRDQVVGYLAVGIYPTEKI